MTNQIDRAAVLELLETAAKGTIILGGQKYRTIQLEEIAAAIRALPAAQVKVKPLVWECDARWPSTVWSGGYQINDQDENEWLMTTPQGDSATFETIDAAKAAAQADYEARILATLDLSPTAVDASQTPDPVVSAPSENAKVKGETVGKMLERLGMDGAMWAAEFRTTALQLGYSDMDEGWLTGWFCNAIMAGYDRSADPVLSDPRVKALVEVSRNMMMREYRTGCSCTSCEEIRDELRAALRAIGGEA